MKPVVLTILDGFGLKNSDVGNAVKSAKTPTFDFLWGNYPHSTLEASGQAVGLPKGQMGNSEVGHMNIGAGRIVYQPLELINSKIKDKSFFDNSEFKSLIKHVRDNNSKLHICGLLSDGGVHSHIEQLFAIIDLCKIENIKDVYYHLFLDGRDTLPDSALVYLDALKKKIEETNIGNIATISGRFYAMDRDNRWDRVKLAYTNMVKGTGNKYNDYTDVIKASYSEGIYDEFVKPVVLDDGGLIEKNDGLLVFNYRPDRLRELFSALTNKEFNGFEREFIENLKLVTMMPVSDEVIYTNAFKLDELINTFGEYISDLGYSQLRIAETEKYAHVTYFFDGGVEKELQGCERILIPSPKVATYDMKPEMSAKEVTDSLMCKIDNFDVVILNFANPDMVGHTGDFNAAVKAVETVDRQLTRIYEKTQELGGTLIVTADHGNCEEMIDEEGNILTAHTTNAVPFIICDKKYNLKSGKLGDIAPTILDIMGLDIPKEMSGESLIK
ncbi:MAG: 2,3-bisphosphoglycerate-independent phosphoglycerate mutase [Bacilli bacterium]|nr:2,3-bisphosphoglycerate-independent phosphoglycerate mutase [Bacilli bacterium]